MLAQIESAIKAIDHASQQSLVWVLIAVVVAFGVFVLGAIRFLLRREDDRAKSDKEDRTQLVQALTRNTSVIEQNSAVMQHVSNALGHLKI